jgi:hypothetical protein
MKLLNSLFFTLCLSFVIISCQQPVDDDFPDPNSNYDNDSTKLVRFAAVDTARPAGLDTIEVWVYDRDNKGRMNKVSYFGRDQNNATANWEYSEVRDFLYNGNDTLPYKMIGYYSGHGAAFRWDTVFYNYNAGVVSYDSIRYREIIGTDEEIGMDVRRYTVTGPGTVTMIRTFSQAVVPNSLTNSCTETHSYVITRANGNIVSESGNMTGVCTNGSTTGGGTGAGSVVYDNHPNPFYQVSLKWPVLDQPRVNNPLFPEQKNNILETGSIGPGFSYTYNSLGYPTVLRYLDPTLPSNYLKAIYFYKKQ